MSTLYAEAPGGDILSTEKLQTEIRLKIEAARDYRKRFEPTWKMNMAIAAGQFWLEVDRRTRQLVMPSELRGKELYTADVVTEYRETALGELGSDDDRPELLLRRDDAPSEDYQHQLNKAVEYGWDVEFDADTALAEADRLCVDLGTSAIRCKWDPNYGPVVGTLPHLNGQPVHDPAARADLFANGPNPAVEMRPVREGRICWEPLSAFNMLVPSGIPHEKYFPWECVVRPAPLSSVKAEYGPAAADLLEDMDIGSMLGDSTGASGGGGSSYTDYVAGSGGAGRLRGFVWLFTYLERPSPQWPNGRTITLASNRMKLIRVEDHLPYQAPNGDWRSGISYFHWWRVTGRFWSRGLTEVMKDIQRAVNKRRTQINEIIDRSMPYTLVEKDSEALNRSGVPGEFIELRKDERQPVPVAGAGPGPWMQQDVEAMREDLEHATGIRAVRLGENPTNVGTYSQLALINENDQGKRQKIVERRKAAIGRLVEDSVYDMRTYWGSQKQLLLAGDEDQIDAAIFNATQIPAFVIVRVAKGSTRPRSQAAELKKIEDIARYSIEAGQPVPVHWLKDSYNAGQALDLPDMGQDEQAEKAQLENHMMLEGELVQPDYFDPPGTHIPIHRSAQIQARLSGDQRAFDTIEEHIQLSKALALQNAQQVNALLPAPAPATGPAPAAGTGPAPGQGAPQ